MSPMCATTDKAIVVQCSIESLPTNQGKFICLAIWLNAHFRTGLPFP